jgi:hypothetical protein
MHRLAAALDQQEQEIEIPGDERHLPSLPDKKPPLRTQCELVEAISNHDDSFGPAIVSTLRLLKAC